MNPPTFKHWLFAKPSNEVISTCVKKIYKDVQLIDPKRAQIALEKAVSIGPLRTWINDIKANKKEPRVVPTVQKYNALNNKVSRKLNKLEQINTERPLDRKYFIPKGTLADLLPKKRAYKSPNLRIYQSYRYGACTADLIPATVREKRVSRVAKPTINQIIREISENNKKSIANSLSHLKNVSTLTIDQVEQKAISKSVPDLRKTETDLMVVDRVIKNRISISRLKCATKQWNSLSGWNKPSNINLLNKVHFEITQPGQELEFPVKNKIRQIPKTTFKKMNKPEPKYSSPDKIEMKKCMEKLTRAQQFYKRIQLSHKGDSKNVNTEETIDNLFPNQYRQIMLERRQRCKGIIPKKHTDRKALLLRSQSAPPDERRKQRQNATNNSNHSEHSKPKNSSPKMDNEEGETLYSTYVTERAHKKFGYNFVPDKNKKPEERSKNPCSSTQNQFKKNNGLVLRQKILESSNPKTDPKLKAKILAQVPKKQPSSTETKDKTRQISVKNPSTQKISKLSEQTTEAHKRRYDYERGFGFTPYEKSDGNIVSATSAVVSNIKIAQIPFKNQLKPIINKQYSFYPPKK